MTSADFIDIWEITGAALKGLRDCGVLLEIEQNLELQWTSNRYFRAGSKFEGSLFILILNKAYGINCLRGTRVPRQNTGQQFI